LQLINAAIIYDAACTTSWLFRKSFNCRYNPKIDYAFCLLTLKIYEKWRFPLFGATCNFNDQILPYQGRIQDFKLGGRTWKKLRRTEEGAKIVGVFRVKNHDFTPKNHIFPILGGRAPGASPPDPPLLTVYYF
jgi:hypothetical protein